MAFRPSDELIGKALQFNAVRSFEHIPRHSRGAFVTELPRTNRSVGCTAETLLIKREEPQSARRISSRSFKKVPIITHISVRIPCPRALLSVPMALLSHAVIRELPRRSRALTSAAFEHEAPRAGRTLRIGGPEAPAALGRAGGQLEGDGHADGEGDAVGGGEGEGER